MRKSMQYFFELLNDICFANILLLLLLIIYLTHIFIFVIFT